MSHHFYSAAYGANFVTKNNLSQKPIDVVSDDLASQFRDLQKNRFTKDKLPRLPDLPPPSPTNALMLPDQPQKVTNPLADIFDIFRTDARFLIS